MEHVYEIVIDAEKVNDYIRGRINGMIYILTRKPDMSFGWSSKRAHNRWLTKTQCSEETFNEIIKTIEHVYPGVIVESQKVS